jgi:hypothetical protein
MTNRAGLSGYGSSGDGYHITSPREDGIGATLAMQRALRQSGLDPSQLPTVVNAHATSTPVGKHPGVSNYIFLKNATNLCQLIDLLRTVCVE